MRDLTCVGSITFRPRTAANDDPALVTPAFRKAAQKQGLANPLTGLKDPRLKNPDSLLEENWLKNGDYEPDFAIYRYEGGGKTIQYYARSAEGVEAIATFNHADGKRAVEHIVKQQDGSITRSQSFQGLFDPQWERGYPELLPGFVAYAIYGDLTSQESQYGRAQCR